MKKIFKAIRTGNSTEYSDWMTQASATGWSVETCGATAAQFWAILSRPERLLEGSDRFAGTISAKMLEVAQALAENNLNTSTAARDLGVKRTTLQARVKRIKDKTGLDPMNFYDLNELLYMEVDDDEHGTGEDPGARD